jgi:S-adenosylmethionine decarboxylase proenzyme
MRALIHNIASAMDTVIFTEGLHRFTPVGVTAYAVVSASHIALHTWPEHGYLGLDIFSCKGLDQEAIVELLKDGLHFKWLDIKKIPRGI